MNLNLALANFKFEIALLIFVAYVVVDGMYAYYTLQVTKRRPYSAATVGALMHFILAFGILNYVQNFLYIFPLALGSWVGTFIIVRKEQNSIIPPKK